MNREWYENKGITFLKKVGIRRGDRVLDFGCRIGAYAVPAAVIAGEEGEVIGVDKDKSVFEDLEYKTLKFGLNNLKYFHTDGKIDMELEPGSFDVVLLFDVVHYFDPDERKNLYSVSNDYLKNGGLLSIYPPHLFSRKPKDERYGNLTEKEFINEVTRDGFEFVRKVCGQMNHYEKIMEDCTFNFRK